MNAVSTRFAILFGVFLAVYVILSMGITIRTVGRPPRDQRRGHRWHVWMSTGIMLPVFMWYGWSLVQAWRSGNAFSWLGVAMFLLFFLILGQAFYLAYRPQRENEFALNYRFDPAHCGRCGYDLTGNTSGTCPECGWGLP